LVFQREHLGGNFGEMKKLHLKSRHNNKKIKIKKTKD
jgi:hypothetical protein